MESNSKYFQLLLADVVTAVKLQNLVKLKLLIYKQQHHCSCFNGLKSGLQHSMFKKLLH